MLKDTVINNLQNGMKPLIEALYAPYHVKAEMNDDLADDNSKKSAHKSIEYRKKGNDFYSKKDHSEIDHEMILHFYSKSAAYAPQGSEELALAYGNRSALWLHLRKYDLCLIDIDRALQVTKCNNLKGKLLKRQEGCLNLRSDIPNKPKKLQFLAYNPSKLLPCAANSVALVHNEKYGWHYIANRNIKPGEIVISEDTSYASVENDQIYLVCSHCLAFAWAGIPCDSCVFAIYCSEHCKQEAWNQYHDTMCSKLPILHSIIAKLSADVFSVLYLSTRIVDTFIKKEGIEKVLEEAGKFDKEQDHNSGKFSADMGLNCKKFGTLYNLSNAKIDCDTETASVTSIFNKLNFIIDLNIFKFIAGPPECDDNSVCRCINLQSCIKNKCAARGRVIGPCSSFINHSCMPNVRQIFLPGPKIIVLSMRPINKGEQVSF
ncbi:hypothetical protein QAD02_023014 [Eretmocerus hayati]|uniref:Uncharacterized protein n=1 Tax=Eretmocerus hayati TaxID=131215 RepID=A0ACC2PUE1_9HYME|nr:hypothetical protein QAD02_023014 [Eretmocerus hayati]